MPDLREGQDFGVFVTAAEKRERRNAQRQYKRASARWEEANKRIDLALLRVDTAFYGCDYEKHTPKMLDRSMRELSAARAELRAAIKSYMTWTRKRAAAIARKHSERKNDA